MELFGISIEKGLVILVLALLVVGPQKMIEFARTAGKLVAEFKTHADALRQVLTLEGAPPPAAPAPLTTVAFVPAASAPDERVLALHAYTRPRPADPAAVDQDRAS